MYPGHNFHSLLARGVVLSDNCCDSKGSPGLIGQQLDPPPHHLQTHHDAASGG